MNRAFAGASIVLMQGDITKVPVDAIVNAANSELVGGGGVDGAIHRAAGPELMLELNKVRPPNGCPTGSAVITKAYKLPAKWVIHAVGPVWRGGDFQEDLDLADAYKKSLELAAEKGAVKVSFPAISTGVYGYPVDKAARVAVKTTSEFLLSKKTSIKEAVFVLFSAEALAAYGKALATL
ncbi:MAG: O-acetyl-ADP-ribose deacetylase [Elusimicrobia bacterium]|nr:O-acetyl-ADP-ribose deacetylase [Elusimicrobiota bacterium]